MTEPRPAWLRHLPLAGALAILLVLGVVGVDRARHGLCMTDEGLYLTTPLRYSLGDLPFQDEILGTGSRPLNALEADVREWVEEQKTSD